MKYFSMFSGIGGIELGIRMAWNKIWGTESKEKWEHNSLSELHIESKHEPICVGYSEIDKYAIQIYKKHFNHKEYGDVSKINWNDVEDFEMLVGGFPCQAFSIAGKRRGFDDTRGTLFFEIARAAQEKQPRFLLLENVKGLLSHDKGRTFGIILNTLDELGYDLQWQVLNSKNFGVPQNRERVFIIGHLRGTSRPKVFPITKCSKSNLAYSAGVISQREKWIKGEKHLSREFSQGQRVYATSGISQTLAGNAGGQGGKTGLYQLENMKIRRLTPTECERLQEFPDGWTEYGLIKFDTNKMTQLQLDILDQRPEWLWKKIKISDTQRYKCLGNAVTVNVVEEIIKKWMKK